MRKNVALGLALLAVAVLPVVASDSAPAHPDRLGFEVSISPVQLPPGANPRAVRQYEITAVVRQLETGNVIFAPKVYALEGAPATVIQSEDSPERFSASFLVDGSSAKYTIERAQRGERLAVSVGTIQLAR